MTAEEAGLREQVDAILWLRAMLRQPNLMPFNEAQTRVFNEMMEGLPALEPDDDDDPLPDLDVVD